MSDFFDAVDRMIKNWKSPVQECNELGLPAVYVRDGDVVWHFADGEIIPDALAGDRAMAILNSAAEGEQADMARRIRTRYQALTSQSSGGETGVDWDVIFDEIAEGAERRADDR